ncbi:MAG: hypothetical protein LUG91_08360 [Ruminococcus sp.]|nr:hypothetical protein [Ruminococcus sp.]
MNKHTRLLVSVLFAVIIVLAVGITRFYMNVSNDTGSSGNTADVAEIIDSDSEKNQIFIDTNGFYGILNASGYVIVSPEWNELSFIGGEMCLASRTISGKLLTGCIDYEGNAVVPFIYKSITEYSYEDCVFYAAETDSDGSCVIYDENFDPCFMRSWDSCTVSENNLILQSGECSYTYSLGESGFTCTLADINGSAADVSFSLNISSRLLLSKLNSFMLEKVAESISDYLEFAVSGDQTYLADITDLNNYGSFKMLFPDDEKIVSRKLTDIDNIFIYSDKSDDSGQSYTVSITAGVQIRYINENDSVKILSGSYRAVLKFNASGSEITAVSGEFLSSEPDYPEKEDLPEKDNNDEADKPENT